MVTLSWILGVSGGIGTGILLFVSLIGWDTEDVFEHVNEAPIKKSFWWAFCALGAVTLKSKFSVFSYCPGCKSPAPKNRGLTVCPHCGCDFKTTPVKKGSGRCVRRGKSYKIEMARQPQLLSNEGVDPRYR